MLILRSSPPSPFGRKARIAAAMLGLANKIEVVAADTNNPDDSLRQQNPLGKIPTLVLDDGSVLFDSRVIVEYFDHMAGGNRLIPTEPKARFAALTLQALGDGLMDACILRVYENRFRDEARRDSGWVAYQSEKVKRVLVQLAANPPKGPRNIGHVAVACALGYLDLRFDGAWRTDFPVLVAWLDAFSADVPAYEATRFIG